MNSIQLFGLVLLGGLLAGELSRRACGLPRTTGFVVFGLLMGQSGLQLISPQHIESAQLIVDLALGLILFELGYLVPRGSLEQTAARMAAGFAASFGAGFALFLTFLTLGFGSATALFAASLCLATSPAITIATSSDVGAKGERSGLLFALVATNGAVAFVLLSLITPFLNETEALSLLSRITAGTGSITGGIILGGACSGLVLLGAEWLERKAEHQHLLILGTIILGIGTAIYLDISVLLPMLVFGFLVRAIDHDNKVIAIRIASDARIFLVIAFVLAGAALDIAHLIDYWPYALLIASMRFAGHFVGLWLTRPELQLSQRDTLFAAIGLQPMSSVALVLLINTQTLYTSMPGELSGMLMATILLMQLLGPLSTQTAIKGFGEATKLSPSSSDKHLKEESP